MDQNNNNNTNSTTPNSIPPATPPVTPVIPVVEQKMSESVSAATTPIEQSSVPPVVPQASLDSMPVTESVPPQAPVVDPSLQMAEASMTPPPADTVVPTDPAPTNPADAGYTKTKSHNMLFVVIAIVSIVAVSLLVLFFYQQYRALSAPEEVNAKPIMKRVTPTLAVTPTVTPASQEERELQNIKLEDVDHELTDIEKDVNQL